MKKNIIFLFSPIILISGFLILVISLIIPKIPNNPNLSSPSLPPEFSIGDFTSNPVINTSNPTTFIAVGDIMLGRFCNIQMLNNKDWKYPFLTTADFTSKADITFGNLEAPIVENCPTSPTGMVFCARPEAIEGLKFAGFDILSLANNHILNHGQEGLDQTTNLLNVNTILPSQGSKIAIKHLKNLSLGFLAFDLVTYSNTPLLETIMENAEKVDILMISLHWGAEYSKIPTETQKKLAREIIDAGAKIIIGHHPHVTQPVEEYHNGLIFYSLGNFVFDQAWSEETKKGEMAKIIFAGKEIKSYELVPVYSENYCQPKLLN